MAEAASSIPSKRIIEPAQITLGEICLARTPGTYSIYRFLHCGTVHNTFALGIYYYTAQHQQQNGIIVWIIKEEHYYSTI